MSIMGVCENLSLRWFFTIAAFLIKVGLFYDRVIPLKIKIKAHFSWYWLVFKTWVYFWRSRWHFLRSKYFFKTLCELFNDLGALFNNWGDFQRSRSHFFRSLLEIDLRVLLRGWFFDCAFSFSLTHFSVLAPYFLSISGFSSTLYIYFSCTLFLILNSLSKSLDKTYIYQPFYQPNLKLKTPWPKSSQKTNLKPPYQKPPPP